jgi:hypothetical protein
MRPALEQLTHADNISANAAPATRLIVRQFTNAPTDDDIAERLTEIREALRNAACKMQAAFIIGEPDEQTPADWMDPEIKRPWFSRFVVQPDGLFSICWLQSKSPEADGVCALLAEVGRLFLASGPRRRLECGSVGGMPVDHWISFLFDLAWFHDGGPIKAQRMTWSAPNCYLPYDPAKLGQMRAEGAAGIPHKWNCEDMPRHEFGIIDDAVAASLLALDWLLDRMRA